MKFYRFGNKWLYRFILLTFITFLGVLIVSSFNIGPRSSQVYAQTSSPELSQNFLNQAKELEAAGQYRQACKVLLKSLEINQVECQALIDDKQDTINQIPSYFPMEPETKLRAIQLRKLGDILRMTGALRTSEQILNQSLKIAEILADSEELSANYFSLGNTHRSLSQKWQELKDSEKLLYDSQKALEEYQKVIEFSNSDFMKLKAKLNELSLSVETVVDTDLIDLKTQQQAIESQWQEIKTQVENLPVSHERVYASLDLAQSLTCIKFPKDQTLEQPYPEAPLLKSCNSSGISNPPELLDIETLLTTAVEQADILKDVRGKSYALGTLGQFYEIDQQWLKAEKLTEEALGIAQAIQAWDIAYRWQWQLGRIALKAQENKEVARESYKAAINSLTSVRENLIAINPDIQFSFRDSVDPVYRQYVDLLLPTDDLLLSEQSTPQVQENLQTARQLIADLQVAEIANFLRCSLQNEENKELDNTADQNNAAIFYPIILPQKFAVIVKLPGESNLIYYQTPIKQTQIQEKIIIFRKALEEKSSFTPDFQSLSQKVYQWLIQKAETSLESKKVTTLVFVLDGQLRNIPMAALRDEEQKYLINKYAVAINLGLQLKNPEKLNQKDLVILSAGLIKEVRDLAPLKNVEQELDAIQPISRQQLRDEAFQSQVFQNLLQSQSFSVVHIATHGQFSSQREETKIEASDQSIYVDQVSEIFQGQSRRQRQPIELLVLSACQTAQDDQRAALGLAGVAVRSGARSTIASLWYLDDPASANLMQKFYYHLQHSNVRSKAEALQLAQKDMIAAPNREKLPVFWAAYILVGNWL
jgi:CHAT domain-containing protein